MASIRCERVFLCSPRTLWSHLTDFSRMHEWFYAVSAVELFGEEPGPGVRRRLVLCTGQTHLERIGIWEEDQRFTIEVLEPPFFSKAWSGEVELTPVGSATRLQWHLCSEPKFGRLGKLGERLLVVPVVAIALRLSLRRLSVRVRSAR